MNIQTLLKELGIPFKKAGEHRHTHRGWVNIECHKCSPNSGKFKLGINLAGGFCSCWTCGGMRLADVLSEAANLPLSECLALLEDIELVRDTALPDRPRGRLKIPDGVGPLSPAHRRYLENRGLNPDVVSRLWGVQGIANTNPVLSWSLFIPFHYRGEVVSWIVRFIGDKKPKYRRANREDESMFSNDILYGEDLVRNTIIIHEGCVDVWTTGPGAVALLGLNYTRAQLLRMSKYPVRVVCLDSDPPGRKGAEKLVRELSQYPGETHLVELESGKDVSEADPEEVQELRRRFLGEIEPFGLVTLGR